MLPDAMADVNQAGGAQQPEGEEAWIDESTQIGSELALGTIFAERFRIDAVLGSGAMGRVLRAFDLMTGWNVALKVLRRERAKDAESLQRFEREAAILSSMGHPGIVSVLAVGAAPDGTPWIAMEMLEGETAQTRLHRGRMDPDEVVPVIATVCDALSSAHERGIIHRDLKPDNVFLLESGDPPCKILDFGLSRFMATKKLTATGTILGSPRYMAPEQIRSASTATHQVDIFSAGVVIFEMFTGRSIYAAEDMGHLLGCVLEGRTRSVSEFRSDLPDAVDEVIKKATNRDLSIRFQDARALALALSHAVRVPVDASARARKQPTPRSVKRPVLPPTPAGGVSRPKTMLGHTPAPVDPAPHDPASVDPAPVKPAPFEPAMIEPLETPPVAPTEIAPLPQMPAIAAISASEPAIPHTRYPTSSERLEASDSGSGRIIPETMAPTPAMQAALGNSSSDRPIPATMIHMEESDLAEPRVQLSSSLDTPPTRAMAAHPAHAPSLGPSGYAPERASTVPVQGAEFSQPAARPLSAPPRKQNKKPKGMGLFSFFAVLLLMAILGAAGGLALRFALSRQVWVPGVGQIL